MRPYAKPHTCTTTADTARGGGGGACIVGVGAEGSDVHVINLLQKLVSKLIVLCTINGLVYRKFHREGQFILISVICSTATLDYIELITVITYATCDAVLKEVGQLFCKRGLFLICIVLYKSWCLRCHRLHYTLLPLSIMHCWRQASVYSAVVECDPIDHWM